jgi:hypothetical protein
VKKASDGGANETKEHWVYDVTIENKTFKELTNLDLKYVIFFKKEKLGVKAAATRDSRAEASASIHSSRTRKNRLSPMQLS